MGWVSNIYSGHGGVALGYAVSVIDHNVLLDTGSSRPPNETAQA